MAKINQFSEEFYYLEIRGEGHNKSDRTERIYFSKLAQELVKETLEKLEELKRKVDAAEERLIRYRQKTNETKVEIANDEEIRLSDELENARNEYNKFRNNYINDKLLSRMKLYVNEKGQYVLTRKKKTDNSITFIGDISSSFRGTSWIKEKSREDIVLLVATGCGNLYEHTEFIATLESGDWIIGAWDGRNDKGYKFWKNDNGKLVYLEFKNDGKYCPMPSFDDAKIAFGFESISAPDDEIDEEDLA